MDAVKKFPALQISRQSGRWVVFLALAILGPAESVWAGGTPATGTVADEVIMITGSESKTEDGDYLTANDGLDSHHSFFIEVPAGATSLEVDLWDLDVLFGIDDGTNTEQTAERDRIRRYELHLTDPVLNFNDHIGASVAKYQLFDPDGNAVVTKHIFGSHFAPENADGAWLNFYDSDLADTSSGDQFLDQFGSASYSNNDGNVNFAGDWIEDEQAGVRFCNTGAGAGAGLVRIASGQLRITDDCDFSPDMGREPSVLRELDLSSYTSAVLSFDWSVLGGMEKSDAIVLELSADGGTSWTIIDGFTAYPGVASGSRSYDISDFIATDTQIRFRVENLFAGNNNEVLLIDNFSIRATANAAAAPQAGHWELRVDMSTGANDAGSGFNGDETNAFGFRAHDGDETSGGTEYNVYTYHFTAGINPNDSGRDYTLYPLISSGCDFDVNDFDWDADLASNTDPDPDLDPPFGSLTMTSPDTSFSSGSTLSANDTWAGSNATGFTSDEEVDQYGIWTLDGRVEDPVDGNYAPIYIGSYEDADLIPATIPDPESFRIYLPTDGGGAPVKPYMTQRLTVFTTQPSGGSNPPNTGETTRYAVSLVIWNPDGSAGDITFDPTRLVTARLPGGDVTYQGIAFLTQGTVVSQPTVGSNTAGDLTWNPGTVSAGTGGTDTTETLVYVIDVTGPATPYTVQVNGVPGSGNGTRATWLDETGVEDFSTGELCQMQLVNSAATPVVVQSVKVLDLDGQAVLEWTTASEAGTRAFDIYRVDESRRAVKVNASPISAWIGHAAGGTYRLEDPLASTEAPSTYWIVEIDSLGRRNPYGPFEVEAEPPSAHSVATEPDAGLPSIGPRGVDADYALRSKRAAADRAATTKTIDKASRASNPDSTGNNSVTQIKVRVDREGIQQLTADELAVAFGVSASEMRSAIKGHQLRLTLDDESIAWLPLGDQALLFYGQAIDTPYTDQQVYGLERQRGRAMGRAFIRNLPPDWSGETFRDSLWVEKNLRPIVILDLDPESDTWFWDFVRPGGQDATADFNATIPAVVDQPEEEPSVTVHLQGGAKGDHQVAIHWNGQWLGHMALNGSDTAVTTFELPAGALVEGENTLQLEALQGDLVFLEGFELAYDRRTRAVDEALTLESETQTVATVSGFSDPDIRVFDVTTPAVPRFLRGAPVLPEGAEFRVVFPTTSGRGGPRTYLAVSSSGWITPALEPDQPSSLTHDHPSLDYLVISAPSLTTSAQALVDYRQSLGLESMLVSLEDIYDEFAAGRRDPRAVRDFLSHVWTQWTEPPRLVALVGHGTYDFRNFWGLGDNLLPPLLGTRPGSLFPTDALFGDVIGDDGIPEMLVGRIPALSPQEVTDYVGKLQAYEAQGETAWDHRLLALADAEDSAGDFAADSRHLQSLLGFGFEAAEVHLGDQVDMTTARQSLFDQVDSGVAWVHYEGHGGIDRMSSSGLLLSSDVANLENVGKPHLLTAATCNIGLHAFPGLDSLAERLVLEADRGAIASLAPAWLIENDQALQVVDRLFREIFLQEERVLGKAVLSAYEKAAANGAPADVLHVYQLLGDPATVLQLRPELPPPGCTTDCGNG